MKRYTTHYDAIPPGLLHGFVLDVGCGDLSNQRKSKHWQYLQRATGIDITRGTDMFNWYPSAPYDTVLAIHVIEHIELEKWPAMFERLKAWVKPGGWLVIGCPYMQSQKTYENYRGPKEQRHKVFHIIESTLDPYLEDVYCRRYIGPFSQSIMFLWRKEQ